MDWNGYGLYWAILEMLRNESLYKLPLNKNTYRAIKMQTGTTIDVEKFLNDCINEYTDNINGNGLFNTDDKMFWSASLLRRMEKYETLKEKRRQAANARWNTEKDSSNDKNLKKICKCITLGYAKRYKCNAKLKKAYANLCKSNQIKLNKKDKIDEIDKGDFENMISNSEIIKLEPLLSLEIREILKELYEDINTRSRIMNLNCQNMAYALQQFSIANTKKDIKKPKAYFKKCLLSAVEQTELSQQYDLNTIYENMRKTGG